MQALFACFPALFIILLQYTGTPPAHCNSYAVFFLEKIPFNLSIYGFVHGIFPRRTNNVQIERTIVIGCPNIAINGLSEDDARDTA